MRRKSTLILGLVLFMSCLLHTRYNPVEVKAPDSYPVHNRNTGLNYTSIQEAIDAPETVNGNTIFVQSGLYYEKILVDKEINLIGQDKDKTIIDGNNSEGGVHITRDSVTLNNFTIRNCRNHGINSAIYVDHSDHCEVVGNTVANSSGGILLTYSEACNVSGNLIDQDDFAFGVFGGELGEFMHSIDTSNLVNGKAIYYLVNQSDLAINPLTFPQAGYLALVNSKNVVIENLTLTNNWQGLLLAYVNQSKIIGNSVLDSGVGIAISESFNNSVRNNVASGNGHGIGVAGSGISLDHSQENMIVSNLITGNYIGVNPAWSSGNLIFHNNIMENNEQIYAHSSMDLWNCSSGGNYWSDFNGTDSDQNGIGDTAYVIDTNNTDNYPLMGMFSDFEATLEQHVQTICNSTILIFQFNGTAIVMNVSGENDTSGFCRICVPTALMNDTDRVLVDGAEVNYALLPCSNSNNSYLYFSYKLSTLNTLKDRADLNKDGVVDVLDMIVLSTAWNSRPGNPEWKPEADLNDDGVIDALDMNLLVSVIGETTNIATHEVTIIAEFPQLLILPLFLPATLLAVIVYRRKRILDV